MNWLKKYYAILILVGILFIPSVFPLLKKNSTSSENRKLVAFPDLFSADMKIEKFPQQVDAWAQDSFGFRYSLIKLNNKLRKSFLGETTSAQIVFGQNHRVFLGSHGPAPDDAYSTILQICGWAHGSTAKRHFADNIAATFENYKKANLQPKLIFIPSAPRVHFEDLPPWLQQQCATSNFITDDVYSLLISSNSEFKNQIYYPLELMISMKSETDVYYKTWFHWHGLTPKKIAEHMAQTMWAKSAQGNPIEIVSSTAESDVASLFPGIRSTTDIQEPDFKNTKITSCAGPSCAPDVAEEPHLLSDMSIITNPDATAGTLILLTDSFGAHIAPWYAPYFNKIIHINTNNFSYMSKSQLKKLKDFLFKESASDQFIQFLYHDGSLSTERFVSDSKALGF